MEYCRSCESCQLRRKKTCWDRILINPVVRLPRAFGIMNFDIVGPFVNESSGYAYVLTCIDQCSRWPEAVPLKNVTAKSIVETLLWIFKRTGIPRIVMADNASYNTSELTREFLRRIGVSPRFSTPYLSEGNSLIERYQAVIKAMIHQAVHSGKKDWNRLISDGLGAYREIPNATTGVSSYEMVYGRLARGVLQPWRKHGLGKKFFHLLWLIQLTNWKKNNDLKLNDEHLQAFKDLKKALAMAAVLMTPVFDGKTPFVIQADSSAHSVGACLTQGQPDGSKRLIAFTSSKLTPTQRNWSTIEREGYAVIFALRKFETYLIGAPIFIYTDHNPLQCIVDCSPKSARLIRWVLRQWRIQGGYRGPCPQTVDNFFYKLSILIIDGLSDECSHWNILNRYLNSQKAFASGGLRPSDPLPSVSL